MSVSARPSLHTHTNAVSRGSQFTGDHLLSVVSTYIHRQTNTIQASAVWVRDVTFAYLFDPFSVVTLCISQYYLIFFIRLNNSSVISYILLFWTVFQPMIASTTIKVCLTENLLPDL